MPSTDIAVTEEINMNKVLKQPESHSSHQNRQEEISGRNTYQRIHISQGSPKGRRHSGFIKETCKLDLEGCTGLCQGTKAEGNSAREYTKAELEVIW